MGSLPPALDRIVKLFRGAPNDLKLAALLEYSKKVPPLPERLAGDRAGLEQVTECVTPFFLATEVTEGKVQLHFDCPPEAPTTRGYAGILAEGLNGATVAQVLDVPDDFYSEMGLQDAISGQRLRGMWFILHRLKRQVREAA